MSVCDLNVVKGMISNMDNIQYSKLLLTEEMIIQLESIRYNAYNMNTEQYPIEKTYHTMNLKKENYLVFGCFLNNQLVGACYTSKSNNSLYIEQLFILKKYQRTSLYLGKNLLLYVLKNKEMIEEYFHTTFDYSYLDAYGNTSNLYTSIGYKKVNHLFRKKL